jgi:tetratricopeptide (TPR) repeat protein
VYCQRCGKKNKPEVENCKFCGAPLLVLKQERTGEAADMQSFFSVEEYVIDKISNVEKQAHRSSEDVDLLVQAVDFLERNVMVNRAGTNVLVRMLREKGILDPYEFNRRWRERTLSNLMGLYRKERFQDAKPHILGAFSGRNRRRFEDRVLQAEDLLYAFRPIEAVASLEEALALDPNNGPLLNYLGDAYLGLKDYDSAVRCLSKSMALKGQSAEAMIPYAQIKLMEGDVVEAEKILQRVVRREKASVDAWTLLSLVHGLKGEWKQCRENAEKALTLEHAPAPLFLQAHALLQQKKITAAETRLDQLLADYPDVEEPLLQRALLFLARGWWSRASEILARLKALNRDVDTEALVETFKKAAAPGRRAMSVRPLTTSQVLDMMDTVAEEASMYLRQMDMEK